MRKSFLLLFLFTFLLLSEGAEAVTYISGCADLNTSNELYILNNDINQTANMSVSDFLVWYYCIKIIGGNITLDCNGHYIDTNLTASNHSARAIFVRRMSFEGTVDYTNITIKNCRLYNSYIGISLSSVSSVSPLHNINIYNIHSECMESFGMELTETENLYLENVTSYQSFTGFRLGAIDNGTIVNSTSSTNMTRDYHCPNISAYEWDGFYMEHMGNFNSYNYDATLINTNSSYNERHGIHFVYDANITIINSTITHNTYDGLNFYQYSIGNTDLTFYNNNISNNGRYGLFLYNTNISAQQNWVCNNVNYDFWQTNNTNITPYDTNNYCDNISSPDGYNWTDYNTTGCTFNCSAPYPPPPPPPPPAPPTVIDICENIGDFFGTDSEGGCLFLAMLIIAMVMANVGFALKKYIPEAVDIGVLVTALVLVIIFTLIGWINIFISIVGIILIILLGYYYMTTEE